MIKEQGRGGHIGLKRQHTVARRILTRYPVRVWRLALSSARLADVKRVSARDINHLKVVGRVLQQVQLRALHVLPGHQHIIHRVKYNIRIVAHYCIAYRKPLVVVGMLLGLQFRRHVQHGGRIATASQQIPAIQHLR